MITGWVNLPDEVDRVCESLAKSGHDPVFGSAKKELAGNWSRTLKSGVMGVFLWKWEQPVLGKRTAVDFQQAGIDPGTCVGRGMYRAIQDCLGNAVWKNQTVGRAVELAFEVLYGGGRVNIGKGRLGNNGGCVVAWAAEFAVRFGICERGRYGQIDLTKPNERLAELWGRPGVGVPRELMPELAPVKAAHQTRCVQDLADAVSAGYGAAQGTSWMFGNRDRKGFAKYSGPTAHCENVRGVFRTLEGGTGFVRQQSHGEQTPSGPSTLVYAGGEEPLPPGCYAVYEEDLQQAMNTGETWVMAEAEFRPKKASDFVRGKA